MSPVQSVKYLDTWIDSIMSLQFNMNSTCGVAYYYITNVRRIRKYENTIKVSLEQPHGINFLHPSLVTCDLAFFSNVLPCKKRLT